MATVRGNSFLVLKYSLIAVLILSFIGTFILLSASIVSLCDSYETINRYEVIIEQFGSLSNDFHDLLRNVPFNPLTKAKQQETTALFLLFIYSTSLSIEVIGLIGAIKENELLMFISPAIMALLTVAHFFTGQRPKAMTVMLSFTVTLLAFIYILMIRRVRRMEAIRSRMIDMNLREMLDIVVTTSGNVVLNKGQQNPPPYDQIDPYPSVK